MAFSHSDVLFCGEDGLSLEFNVQNAKNDEKNNLRDIIEHGGGLCSDNAAYDDNAIYLVSPGTRVINVSANKKLISSKYIFDCVRQNFLLDTDDYRIEINEMETSDFSDNSPDLINSEPSNKDNSKTASDIIVENSVDILDPKTPNLVCVNSNHDFDFEENGNKSNIVVANKEIFTQHSDMENELQPPEPPITINEASVNAVSDSLNLDESVDDEQNMFFGHISETGANVNLESQNEKVVVTSGRDSPVSAVIVSSSQKNDGDDDEFDHNVLSRIQERPIEKEDDLSQSYTVSSSADVVSSKTSSHHTIEEIFGNSPDAPDSASQLTETQEYIRSLEQQVEQILQKPSPRTIEDKIAFVKYICCVRKLPPAKVLQTLQSIRK